MTTTHFMSDTSSSTLRADEGTPSDNHLSELFKVALRASLDLGRKATAVESGLAQRAEELKKKIRDPHTPMTDLYAKVASVLELLA